jgi:hypothetical protein
MKFLGIFLISLLIVACIWMTITAIMLSPVIKIVKFIITIFVFIMFHLDLCSLNL